MDRLKQALKYLEHGQSITCPTCGAEGLLDKNTPPGSPCEFPESVWFNKYTNKWECWYCWLK